MHSPLVPVLYAVCFDELFDPRGILVRFLTHRIVFRRLFFTHPFFLGPLPYFSIVSGSLERIGQTTAGCAPPLSLFDCVFFEVQVTRHFFPRLVLVCIPFTAPFFPSPRSYCACWRSADKGLLCLTAQQRPAPPPPRPPFLVPRRESTPVFEVPPPPFPQTVAFAAVFFFFASRNPFPLFSGTRSSGFWFLTGQANPQSFP